MTQRVSSALADKMFAVQTVLWSLQFSKSNSFELYKHYQTPLNFFRSGTVNLEMINEISTYTPPTQFIVHNTI